MPNPEVHSVEHPNTETTKPFPERRADLNNLLVKELIKLIDRDRKSRNLRFFLIAAFIIAYVGFVSSSMLPSKPFDMSEGYAATVKVDGGIMPNSSTSAERINNALEEAFNDEDAAGVILWVNSPGGTAVQASNIVSRIKQLRKRHPDKPFYAVCEDYCTSGAYMISVEADEIIANPATIAGSIGVVTRGFGYSNLINLLGVERRVYAAGSHKNSMDPFEPISEDAETKHHAMLNKVHKQFIKIVTEARGDKLSKDLNLFEGDIWVGEDALALGLIDEIGTLETVIEEKLKVKHYKDYTHRGSVLTRLTQSFGAMIKSYVMEQELMSATQMN